MGMMTSIGILNDDWHRIQEDPEKFVRQIAIEMNGHEAPDRFHSVTVLPAHHADNGELILAQYNEFGTLRVPNRFTPGWRELPLEERRRDLKHAGDRIKEARLRLNYEAGVLKEELAALSLAEGEAKS